MYDIELKRKWDRANILAYPKEQARKEGLAEGKAEGLAEVVVNGWKNGLSLDQLQTITGWGKEKITEVLKHHHLL